MDSRPKRPPPVPKFQDSKDKAQLEQKLNSFMNSLGGALGEVKQKKVQQKGNEMKNESTKQQSKIQKKKTTLASINSKLNNMLNAKKINIATAITTEIQREKKQQIRKIVELQYDPQYPNSYQFSKNNYIHLLSAHSDTQSSEEDIKQNQQQPEIIPQTIEIEQEEEWKPEEKEQIALRMMQKFGYKVGQGLGKQSQGIKTPLIVRKTTDNSGVIELSSIPLNFLITPEISAKNALAAHNVETSEVIVLVGLLNMQQLQQGLQQQIKEQCCLYGIIVDWMLYLYGGQLRIFVEFQTKEQGLNAFIKMNSKYFGQKLVSVRFYNAEHFKAKILNNHLHPHIST